MTEIEKKALALLNECGWGGAHLKRTWNPRYEALCRAIEAHDAYRQELSEAVEAAIEGCGHDGLRAEHIRRFLSRFIIQPKTDPLVEAIREMALTDATPKDADRLRAALAKRGLEIREVGE